MGQQVPKIKFEHIGGVHDGMDVVYEGTLAYFKPSKRDSVTKKIRRNLEAFYIAAWKAYIANKSILPSCVTSAMDNLHNYVPEIYLNFTFASASAYFDELSLKGKLSGEQTVWINGKMTDYGGDIGGGAQTDDNVIFLVDAFSSPSKHIEFNTILNGCDYRTHLNEFDLGMGSQNFFKNWKRKNGSVKNSIPGLIFHELVHMALKHSTISSRAGDEATVEDLQLKIFPGAMPIYEGNYFSSLWKYKHEKDTRAFTYF